MSLTPYSDINTLLNDFQETLEEVLTNDLLGLYLYGSLIWGDFDKDISDIDFLAVIESETNPRTFAALENMHTLFAEKYPDWFNRIEVHYVPKDILKTPLEPKGNITVISPGEPLNQKEVTKHYMMNWYFVQEQSETLFGEPSKAFITPISQSDFFDNVRRHAEGWTEWIKHETNIKGQSYAVLTLCRAMYSLKHAKQGSKQQAAGWAKTQYPQWQTLIEAALEWRVLADADCPDGQEMHVQVKDFVAFAYTEILNTNTA